MRLWHLGAILGLMLAASGCVSVPGMTKADKERDRVQKDGIWNVLYDNEGRLYLIEKRLSVIEDAQGITGSEDEDPQTKAERLDLEYHEAPFNEKIKLRPARDEALIEATRR